MVHDRIAQYYRLCTVRTGGRRHIIDSIKNEIGTIVNKKEMDIYFRIQDGYLVPKEIVIGGNDSSNTHVRLPIIVI